MAIIDSQSARTVEDGKELGFYAGNKNQRSLAASSGRYFGAGEGGRRARRILARSLRRPLCARASQWAVPTLESRLRRQSLRTRGAAGVGAELIRLDSANRTPARCGTRLCRVIQTLDRQAHFRLAVPSP